MAKLESEWQVLVKIVCEFRDLINLLLQNLHRDTYILPIYDQ